MLEDKARAGKIRKRLRLTYPEVTTQLHYGTSFELLVATILSAQCTDKQVNGVTRDLFKKFNTPKDFAKIPLESLEQLVRPTGFFRNKAKNIKACAQSLVEKYHGKVPETLEELVLLPGVGRKTANLVLGAAFGIPGIVVDTHVARISKRLGVTESKDPVKIERDLMKIIPKKAWSDFSLHLVYFGREFCTARKPRCKTCPLIKLCPWPDKIL
ncbi:MAG TPA: endonuclease III [Desulfobacterales bacterium]|nr:endonuclease III [Desulfobacterales bacterium]